MKTIKNVTCTALVGLTLLVQLMNPTRAYADDKPPPPPTEPAEVPMGATPNEKPLPPKTPTEAPAELTTLPEILEQISGETNVVALDDSGKPLPLASQEAAAVVATGDPVWCPAGQAPTPGANGCTISYLTLSDLVAAEGGTIAANGTIWITTGLVADLNPIVIDGSTYTNWANYDLTLQGGWDGVSGSTAISSNSVFTAPIAINTWIGNVTINNLTVQNTNNTGLSVVTQGTITASNVTANGNVGRGAVLHGQSGVSVTGTNEFSNNTDSGLWAVSNGDITLNQAIASWNGVYGVDLYTFAGSVTVDQVLAEGNRGHGVFIQAPGTITASNITANNNLDIGAALLGASGVTVTGTNEFYGNRNSGLWVVSDGNITLNHSINDSVTANGNGVYGADLYSYFGSVTVTGTNQFNMNATHGLIVYSPLGITMTGENEFSFNGGNGLVVGSDGPITLNNVTGTGNTTDVFLFSPDSATINNSIVSSLDAEAVCGTLALNGVVTSSISYPVVGEHSFVDTYGILRTIDCNPIIYVDGRLLGELPVVVPAQYEFDLSCDSQTLYPVDLPNGDKVTIVCPVSGRALISRLDNTTIPNDLPAGYTYASAFSVAILQDDEPIPVITDGGHVEVSFQVPSQQEGTYSILFWDNGTWIPLNDFLLGPDNSPQSFTLNPGLASDLRTILSGVNVVTKNGVQRVEVSTNFPGVFALAQR